MADRKDIKTDKTKTVTEAEAAKAVDVRAASPPASGTTRIARRTVRAKDFLNSNSGIPKTALLLSREKAATRFHLELSEAQSQLKQVVELLKPRNLPSKLIGRLVNGNGTKAHRVQLGIQLDHWDHRSTITDDEGAFELALPARHAFPSSGLGLEVKGANKTIDVTLAPRDVATNGLVGDIVLKEAVEPLPLSIVAQLKALLPAGQGPASSEPTEATAEPTAPVVGMGEEGESLVYRPNTAVDRFPYSIFIRLVEPQTSIVSPVLRLGREQRHLPATDYFPLSEDQGVSVDYVDRVPVDQPISVDGFRDQLIGIGDGQAASPYETVAMAGTLSLGYLVHMAQQWTPKGLCLGDLVYSVPLAPGEQQRMAIFERKDTSVVRDTETLQVSEVSSFSQETDASTQATFQSALEEVASGGSRFESQSESIGWGASIIIASAGGGSSSSSGSSSSWLQGQRDQSSRASENVQTNVERFAAASRRASRTSMRLAAASESMDVTTRVITNHNHTRALTLQYWEVQRLFEITSNVEGVSLVCLVPLEIVRFLPAFQRAVIDSESQVNTRQEILARYASVLKHADVLERSLPRKHQYGLTLLRQFAADPTATFATVNGAAQDVIHISLSGSFLPFEEIRVCAVTRKGTRLGPVQLVGHVDEVPKEMGDPLKSFPTQEALIAYLRQRRAKGSFTLHGDLALPPAVARNEIIGFEVTRRFRQFDYDLINPNAQSWLFFHEKFGDAFNLPDTPLDHLIRDTVRLTPQMLESELGGPLAWGFQAKIHSLGGGSEETYASGYLSSSAPQELPPSALPIPALQLAPVLRYTQLLEIEAMLQHVVRNTVKYSKAVWTSVTPEERAIMLEGFTIGVPAGGLTDESQDVPLLNCVENRVMGFFGNSMIMPFFIPKQVVDSMGIDNASIQNTLLEFHKRGFTPRKSVVALPTRGVLGEAVLGSSPSAEKIDLTRFWNWADSPADTAPEISAVQVPTASTPLTSGLQPSSALTTLQPLINNINATPTIPGSDGALLQALAKEASAQKGFDASLTGAEQLAKLILGDQGNAEKARADALKTTRDLSAQAIATAGNLYGGTMGNPTAGSSAASSVYGTGGGSSGGGSSGGGSAKDKDKGNSGNGSSGNGTGTGEGSGSSGAGSPGTPA